MMSERRELQTQLYQAALKLNEAVSAIANAAECLERYDFLAEANPGLYGELEHREELLRTIATQLWTKPVQS